MTTPVEVEIVLPVYNEERVLVAQVEKVRTFVDKHLPYRVQITIADNASTDKTPQLAIELAQRLPDVVSLRLEQKGRGRALRLAWSQSPAKVVVYMDIDLSTGLEALPALVTPLLAGYYDIAIGSRLAKGAVVRKRTFKREVLSRGYNLLLQLFLRADFKDAQCGFKAGRAEVIRQLLPEIVDQAWFFDTELLIRAQRKGLRLLELPVVWTDDPDSRVRVVSTVLEDLKGIWRMRTGR